MCLLEIGVHVSLCVFGRDRHSVIGAVHPFVVVVDEGLHLHLAHIILADEIQLP
jgi:hypothetical protein